MSATLTKVEIRNFKSCVDTRVELSKFTPLVGYNNSGKSNILSALQWLLRKTSLDASDFNDSTQPIEVVGYVSEIDQGEIDLMPERQRTQIQRYIVGNELKIRRVQQVPNAKSAEINLSVWDHTSGNWLPNPTGIDNAISVLLPEPIRIGAMENAAEDSSKAKTTTTIGKLLAEFIAPVRTAHQGELDQHLSEVEQRLSAEGAARFAELTAIDSAINQKIDDLFPGMSIKLDFPVPNFEELMKSGTVKVYEGQNSGRSFSSYGHGAQRSIQMALVRHLAEIRRGGAGAIGNTLLLIDEPELYLHPFAIEQIRESLKVLSERGYQVVFSTHSAQMITSSEAQNTLLIRKNQAAGTHSRMRLCQAIQSVVPDSMHQMEQLFTLSHSSQILFADRVVLTEGKTELRLLPCIFKTVHRKTLGQERIALVAQSGVNDTKKSMDILVAMDLPTRAIVDLDYAWNGAISHGFLSATDPDIAAIKLIFGRLGANGAITLNPNTGFPMNGVVKASKAVALMASEGDAAAPIENLHQRMKAQNIWMWKKGAIEEHLGIAAKTERDWASYQAAVELNGLGRICPDVPAILDLIEWLVH